jgi:hypothetical protein
MDLLPAVKPVLAPTPSCGSTTFCSGCQKNVSYDGKTTLQNPSAKIFRQSPYSCDENGGFSYISAINVLTIDNSLISVYITSADGVGEFVTVQEKYDFSCLSMPYDFRYFADVVSTGYPIVMVFCDNTTYPCLDILYDIQFRCSPARTPPTPPPSRFPTSARVSGLPARGGIARQFFTLQTLYSYTISLLCAGFLHCEECMHSKSPPPVG